MAENPRGRDLASISNRSKALLHIVISSRSTLPPQDLGVFVVCLVLPWPQWSGKLPAKWLFVGIDVELAVSGVAINECTCEVCTCSVQQTYLHVICPICDFSLRAMQPYPPRLSYREGTGESKVGIRRDREVIYRCFVTNLYIYGMKLA